MLLVLGSGALSQEIPAVVAGRGQCLGGRWREFKKCRSLTARHRGHDASHFSIESCYEIGSVFTVAEL